jgi:flagellar hook-associated protein 1 FlgK
MSLSASLAAAFSGLTAAARGAETASSNISSAQAPGYAPRTLGLTARGGTPGVAVTGTLRDVDAILLGDRRRAEAAEGDAKARAAAWQRIDTALGAAGDPGSLAGRLSSLETALIAATAQPESVVSLDAVRTAAANVASGLRDAAAVVQETRAAADAAIARDVAHLNRSLAEVATLNGQITRSLAAGRDAAGLMDQRQALVDGIAAIVPLRESARAGGQIALHADSGLALLDGRAVTLAFTPAATMSAAMTRENGALGQLSIDGKPVTDADAGPLAGGRLGAQFAIRDAEGPAAQAALDALARDLIARFSDPAADPTLPPGHEGLFSDPLSSTPPVAGTAGRIVLEAGLRGAGVDDLWRLRDGLGAAAPGPAGSAAQLVRLLDALAAPRPSAAPGLGTAARDAIGLAADVAALLSSQRLRAEDRAGFAAALAEGLRADAAAAGVDTDRELQGLMRLERAYAANARVIQAVDRMLGAILEIG